MALRMGHHTRMTLACGLLQALMLGYFPKWKSRVDHMSQPLVITLSIDSGWPNGCKLFLVSNSGERICVEMHNSRTKVVDALCKTLYYTTA
jgi:hypothetical protein